MRYKIAFLLVPVAVALFLLAPSTTKGQGRGKGGFGGGGFGGGGFGGNRDPNQMFDILSKGRGYFLVTDTKSLRDPLSQFLQDRGITTGQVTRELFAAFNDQAKATFGGNPGGFPGPGMNMTPPGGPFAMGQNGPNPVDTLNQWAEADFKRYDRNGDGFLNQDEMPDQLKAELSKWDTNRDNLISLDEYKVYFAARMQSRGRGGNNQQPSPVTIIFEDEDLETRPVVLRAGKLPTKDLPPWFMRLADKDGQVPLYKWRKAGMDLDEFAEWDRNNDGYITAEEALYKQRLNQLASAKSKAEGDDSPVSTIQTDIPTMRADNGPGGDEQRGKGKGKGGFNKFKRQQ